MYIYICALTVCIKYFVDNLFFIRKFLFIDFPMYSLFITYFVLYTILYVSCNIYCMLLCQTSSAFKDLQNIKIAEERVSM